MVENEDKIQEILKQHFLCRKLLQHFSPIFDPGLCRSDRELIGDHAVGAYLTLSPEFCFVCENSLDGSIVAFAVAASDAKTFNTRYHMAWLPEMRNKYPRKAVDTASNEVS